MNKLYLLWTFTNDRHWINKKKDLLLWSDSESSRHSSITGKLGTISTQNFDFNVRHLNHYNYFGKVEAIRDHLNGKKPCHYFTTNNNNNPTVDNNDRDYNTINLTAYLYTYITNKGAIHWNRTGNFQFICGIDCALLWQMVDWYGVELDYQSSDKHSVSGERVL